jgi:CheY-like chemotaxis protein
MRIPARRCDCRVLVVDDNRDAAESLAEMLRLLGSTVVTAGDGARAVTVANDFRPDLIFLDIGLPQMDGYEVCRRIRRQEWSGATHLVALTGWGQVQDRQLAAEAGFDVHLVKPAEAAALQRLLSSLA